MTLIDSLTHAGVWEDDRQIIRFTVEWGDQVKQGKVEVTIQPYKVTKEMSAMSKKRKIVATWIKIG